jgi:hypothetical protein
MSNETKMENIVRDILFQRDDALRQDLLDKVLVPNMYRLRGGNRKHVGQAGWYTPYDPGSAARQYMPADLDAPVIEPHNHWFVPEVDARDGLAFQFFAGRAWRDMAAPRAACALECVIPFLVMAEALDQLSVHIDGQAAALDVSRRDLFGRHIARIVVPAALCGGDTIRVEFRCGVVATPGHLYAGSTDTRRLSLALSALNYV